MRGEWLGWGRRKGAGTGRGWGAEVEVGVALEEALHGMSRADSGSSMVF